jgi:hypothetical protein
LATPASKRGGSAALALGGAALVKVGDRIPEATLQHFDADGTLQTVSTTAGLSLRGCQIGYVDIGCSKTTVSG